MCCRNCKNNKEGYQPRPIPPDIEMPPIEILHADLEDASGGERINPIHALIFFIIGLAIGAWIWA